MQSLIEAAKRLKESKPGTIGWHRAADVLRSDGLNCDRHVSLLLEVDAALAAKDAAIARLLGTLRVICKNTDPDDPKSYRREDTDGCLADTHVSARMAIAAVNDVAPHPDTARLDKLQRALEWLIENGSARGCDGLFYKWSLDGWVSVDIPAEFADIIKPRDAHGEKAPPSATNYACMHCGSSPYYSERGRCEDCGSYQTPDGTSEDQ